MRTLLKLEELGQLIAVVVVLCLMHAPWWVYPLLLLGPDIGMLGYLVSPKVGAVTYNLFHHKGIACLVLLTGGYMMMSGFHGDMPGAPAVLTTGLVLFGHSSLDRMLGYGLKFGDHFQHTHLGWIGKRGSSGQEQ